MQACGPVVRPHEILQTLIISIPQPSAAVKSFFELSRNFVSPPEAMSALLLYRQQTADLPPIQRLAAGGEIYARSERGQWPPSAAGGVGAHRQGQKGTGHHMVSCPLLSPPPDGGTPPPWIRRSPARRQQLSLRKKQKHRLKVDAFTSGAADEARTRYLHLGKVALYQMSYSRIFCFPVRCSPHQNDIYYINHFACCQHIFSVSPKLFSAGRGQALPCPRSDMLS